MNFVRGLSKAFQAPSLKLEADNLAKKILDEFRAEIRADLAIVRATSRIEAKKNLDTLIKQHIQKFENYVHQAGWAEKKDFWDSMSNMVIRMDEIAESLCHQQFSRTEKIAAFQSKLLQQFDEAISPETKNLTMKEYQQFLMTTSLHYKGRFWGFLDDNQLREQFPQEIEQFEKEIMKRSSEAYDNYHNYQAALEISNRPSASDSDEMQDSCFEDPLTCSEGNKEPIQSTAVQQVMQSIPLVEFVNGEEIFYKDSSGKIYPAKILKIHNEEYPPFFSVLILETGRERNTDHAHLMKKGEPVINTHNSDCNEPMASVCHNPISPTIEQTEQTQQESCEFKVPPFGSSEQSQPAQEVKLSENNEA